ncbi:MAG: glycosyltransferase family 2 protein [Candidatus Latescibacteria bacterium]|jgi:glycosyltransferase involved in cell wall biosynthesis|nr:glycosyltransferase family 2 protein [Candidatus Latescibacterota bacterium]MBT5830027.1 glycosyltransferase family 2 protein [Candidatus Latescibacterota bacterium]
MNKTEQIDVTLVIPLLNEEESLRPLMEKIRTTLNENNLTYEIIFIDDGSTDGSMKVLEELHAAHPEVRVIQFRRNFGKAAAYTAGFERATGQFVITMDADLQDDPAEIPGMLAKLEEGYDLVSGWKKKRFDPLGKTLPSKFFNWVTGRVSGIKIHDFNCGLKAYRNEVVKDVRVFGELHRYIPVLADLEGYRVSEVPVQHHPRQFGVTKYGMGRLLKGFLDLLTVMYIGKYMGRPLHLFGTMGLIFGVLGMGVNSFIVYLWLQTGTIQNRHPLLTLGVLLTVLGVQFICTGLLADMLTRGPQPNEKFNVRKTLE